MKPSENIFLLAVLTIIYFCNTSLAIFDPRETHAVKPAIRREFPILWYSPSSTTPIPIEPQVPEGVKDSGLRPKKPVVFNNGGYTYSKYGTFNRKIEQQSTNNFYNNYDQGQDGQQENSAFQHRYGQDQNLGYSDQNSYYENGWLVDNTNNQKPYEDFAIEIKKPYKDTKDFKAKPVKSIRVAKYDSETGAVCPAPDATGQFVYPPDCKFFVNCWNGRAFVQPCAPGTLFNPETLECDFPTKVQCYGSELIDLHNQYNIRPSAKKQPLQISEPEREWRVPSATNQHPSCPPSFTGLLPHPIDCTKFLQCANGVTFIMDCGPGTVFNPTVSVCDWPYNVKGCEDALKPKTDPTSIPVWQGIDMRGDMNLQFPQERIKPDVVTCSEGQEGLFRHPTDCKKFLQCSNANTHIMDCGPGTVFNPLTSVCDFPYNVEGCGEEDLKTTTEISDFGIKSSVGNSERQSETSFDHRTHWGVVPNVPNNQRFDSRKDYGNNYNRGNENSNPTVSWHPYYNYNNEGNSNDRIDKGNDGQTESSLSGNFNGNPNTYYNDPNLGQSNTHNSEGSQYGSDQNIYVDSSYRLPSEGQNSNESKNDGKQFIITPATPESVTSQQSWNQPETFVDQPGRFKPSTWTAEEKEDKHPTNPVLNHQWQQGEPPFPVYFVQGVQPINGWDEWINITPISGQMLRLRGGSILEEGYLEVQGTQPGWGIVCDHRNAWTLKKANIVCRQLGYTRGAEMAWQGNNNQNDELPWVAADSVDCIGNETYFQSCKFTHNPYCDVSRDAVGIRCLPNRAAYCREDEIPHRGFCYHLANPDTALNHAEALDYCNSIGARLLDVLDQTENNFISEWLVQRRPDVNSIMTSGFGFTTLNRTIWLWEDSNHAKFRFANWWPGWMQDERISPSVGSRPVCVVMKRIFSCYNRPDKSCLSDYFFWDIEDCATSSKGHSYICKRVYNDIGCVYGKGQHYSGKANITESGAQCLPWNDEAIEQHLHFKVVSDEIREKLKEHNYCRNPNPNRELKPWCFTGLNGEFEHCDIPPCAEQGMIRTVTAGRCKPKHFECTPGECIPSPWICDGQEDCTNGVDEQDCSQHLEFYTKIEQHHLDDHDVEKWLNTPLKTCALRCKEADFTCRSFSHKADGNVCLLSDSNIGLTGDLQPSIDYDYYEMDERSINCSDMFVCGNGKCINQSLLCDGKNNCGDRTDESSCNLENYGYEIRLSGSNNTNQGRVEVKVWETWGQVCDDGFGMIAANVACKELGFIYGAQEVRPAGYYGNADSQLFLMDQLKCRGNETSLRECDFDGWGIHNCLPEEAVGIVCKTAVNTCQDGSWKCDNSPECIPTPFICDEVVDCSDRSDEGPEHCEAPFELRLSGGSNLLEGRVEVRHHGIWGTVCDDDFSDTAATVICRSLGYGGPATAIKNGAFGPGDGPIWLDEVFCSGNETQLYRCDHEHWGRHNCGHDEDVGVRCESGEVIRHEKSVPYLPEVTANDILPTDCGKRIEDFDENDEYMARVVQGSVAQKGAYPWQASLRVRGHSRSNHWCGAVIISPLYVLTAAHCLEGYNKGMYFVRAGDYNTEVDDGTEVEANIEDYYIHEDFRKGQRMNNDIALVMLKGQGIPLGRNIMPICLPPENVEYLPGLNCTISGWGSIESGKSVQSHFLRFGWVPILDQSVCQADYVYGEGAISDGMVCAGYLNEGVDSCDGDSGGPLACIHNNAFTLYGLTSWGKHCGEANKPGVYVRIAHYKKWIEQKIQQSSARM
ncbi:uncharacterized protein LOC124302404 isoform X6 [Neodiprion virginianus]|uniref:uncharacterized protein LOC124302404 isoform X6 n=1 Tax=Neodiprion virginianus TaxID=2961670 RepID=UPI001EE71680|nr:uncharacterized protein LOC124302404 isoform X6 [Neodiprion virginianus]